MKRRETKTFVQRVVLLAALCLCTGYLAISSRAGIPAQENQDKKESKTISPEQLAQAKATFNERCARCHGEDGRSETRQGSMLGAPNFTDEKWWQEEKTDERLIGSVTNGKDAMPAFGNKLSKEEITSLVAYVRRFNKASH